MDANPRRSHGKSSPHACRRAHAKWKQSDNNSKTLLEWCLYLQILCSFAFKTSQPARFVSTAWCFLQHRFVKWLLFRAHTHFTVIQGDTAAVFHSVGSSGGALGKKRTLPPSQRQVGGQRSQSRPWSLALPTVRTRCFRAHLFITI